jgi:hypothetical protein
VNQVEVEVVEAERVKRQFEGRFDVVRMVEDVPKLARHEDLFSLDVELLHGLLQTLSDLCLVLVDVGAVDVAVADLQCVFNGLSNLGYIRKKILTGGFVLLNFMQKAWMWLTTYKTVGSESTKDFRLVTKQPG